MKFQYPFYKYKYFYNMAKESIYFFGPRFIIIELQSPITLRKSILFGECSKMKF